MSNDPQINVFNALNFIRDNAPEYAAAKAKRIYLEEFRKTKKALCMRAAEAAGVNAISAQERDAYADPEYIQILVGLREAVEKEEELRWMFISAQAKIEVWRTIEANRRAEAKVL